MKTRSRISSLAFLCLLLNLNLFSQPPDSLWHKTYGGSDDEIGFSVIEPEDGIYVIAGKTESYGNGGSDFYLIKLDNNGDLIWEKTYGGIINDAAQCVCPALYDGYIVTGYSSSYANGGSDVWTLYVYENGDSLGAVNYGGYFWDQGYCVKNTYNQGYIVAGYSTRYQQGDQVYLINFDVSLDTIWTKTYGFPYQDYGRHIEQSSDGGFIIAGYSYASSASDSQVWLLKTDENGDTLWTKKYGGGDNEMAFAVKEVSDGYVVCGETWTYGSGQIDVYVIKTDFNGDTLWTRAFGGAGADYSHGMEFKDDHIYIAGHTSSFGFDNYQIYLLKIDMNGNLIWQNTYGTPTDELVYGFCQTSDGGFIFTGKYADYIAGEDDLFVLKVGGENTGIDQKVITEYAIYPNPSYGEVFIEVPEYAFPAKFTIYDLNGKFIKQVPDNHDIRHATGVDLSGLPSGIYFIAVEGSGLNRLEKVIRCQ